MNKRMLVALVALAGTFVALYLTLYKLGYIGTLVCAIGSCETVQTSKWATFLGFPVGAWGVAYYVAVFVIALLGLTPRLAEHIGLSQLLTAMTGFGLLFSLWLTYLELFVIHAICQWCVISALLAAILFVLCWLDLREVRSWAEELAERAADGLKGSGYGRSLRNTAELSVRAVKPEE
ncbi:MAG: vitamin K epoxide reductase family protein [bacterium]